MTTLVSIQARMGSTRLPGKVLLPISGKPILDWSVSRAQEAIQTDTVIVATGDTAANTAITTFCEREKYEYVVGPEENLLQRHLMAVEYTDAEIIVRITGDSPLIPPAEIDRLVNTHKTNTADYTTNFHEQTPHGIVIDVVEVDVLTELYARGETHPVSELRRSGTKYETVYSPNPDWKTVAAAHLEVNTPDEYFAIVDAFEAAGPDAYAMAEWLIKHR